LDSIRDAMMVGHSDELRLCLEAYSNFIAEGPGNVGEAVLARCLLTTLDTNTYESDSPLTALLLTLLRRLSQTTKEEINAAAFEFSESQLGAIRSAMEGFGEDMGQLQKITATSLELQWRLAAMQQTKQSR